MALADVYDALISKRVYKPPLPHEKAVQIILEGRGRHFDPDVVDAFVQLEATFRNIALTFADHEEERQALGGGPAASAGGMAPRKVLLVDDNPINLEIMSSQLLARGYLVDVAASALEALELHRPGGYDLVLTDLDMPGMDGYGLAAELRRREEGGTTRPTPIFAITASEFDLSAAGARAHGFTGHMLKPLDPDLLERRLRGG
jgi:putative two-component system response regulator